jgi:hypothetical protein
MRRRVPRWLQAEADKAEDRDARDDKVADMGAQTSGTSGEKRARPCEDGHWVLLLLLLGRLCAEDVGEVAAEVAVEEDAPTNPALEEDTRVMVQVCMSASPLTISDVTLSGVPVNLKNASQHITSYLCNAGYKEPN